MANLSIAHKVVDFIDSSVVCPDVLMIPSVHKINTNVSAIILYESALCMHI